MFFFKDLFVVSDLIEITDTPLTGNMTVLLVLPPGRRRSTPALGCPKVDLRDLAPSSDLSPLALLRRYKVGGRYWGTALPSDVSYEFAVSVHNDAEAGLRLWRHAIKSYPAGQGLVVLGASCDAQPFTLRGIPWVRDVEPHGLVQSVSVILSDTGDDFAVLGAAYGRSVLIGQTDGPLQVLTPEYATAWLVSGVEWQNPFDGRSMTFGMAVEMATDARRAWLRFQGIAGCLGIAWWKRDCMARFLDLPGNNVRVSGDPRRIVRHAIEVAGDIAVWTSRPPKRGIRQYARTGNVSFCLIEDGFLRSAGLGSDLFPPFSIVMDRRGIYFDASKESDLEHILQTTTFDPEIIKRARRLIDAMIAGHVTKYGIESSPNLHIPIPPGKTSILVPGQVADDLSVRLGSPEIKGNLELLKAVRRHNAEAFIIFRPHPDVDAGHRAGQIPDRVALQYADRVVRGGSMAGLINLADEIHTMTSLAGFEALIRGKSVVTYGLPFYAGWGLTIDHLKCSRRNRKLCIEELAAGTLLLYPAYLDPVTSLPCGPEVLIKRLLDPTLWTPRFSTRVRRYQGRLRRQFGKALMYIRRQAS
ncbi:capsular polysaccharide export protein, LipB/KpsS family [Gluconobacter oxydans]|uniref:Beta-3-deoxy-D-manno-oct-2-ulosonic acid transferase n=1 Tax=Gluconobacter oxydans TaxID=442 RepID=A0AB35APY2_GLUOY|nr:beta-3-deoxy-D-manno-oct-2-ulosonic acid transferase [Gluconobacter oxydans]MBF0857000.1 beta-3-deoxy-D-manno-oct-2-ulosonic acid transferase [Gluconobacter oxydans]TCW23669.1 capsular polysaccharide export protein [Gluconobacter oxydans]